jgi:putative ABC transport system permease protein
MKSDSTAGPLVAFLCGIAFGIAPAFQVSKADLNESLKESAGRASSGLGRQRMRSVLAVTEAALSLVLLAGASLLIETFTNLLRVSPGFDPHRVLSVKIWPAGGEIPTTSAMVSFHRNVIGRIDSIPGIQSAAIVTGGLPPEQGGNEYFEFPGQEQGEGISADYREITRDYFRALGVPLERGRFFTDSDAEESRHAAIINEEMVREHFPNVPPLGQHVKLEGNI